MKGFIRDHLLTTLIILGSLFLNYLDKPNWAVGILIVITIICHLWMIYITHCYIGLLGKTSVTPSELKSHKLKGKNLLQ